MPERDPLELAKELCRIAVEGSPDRKTASVRLQMAAATLAVTEGAELKHWVSGTLSAFDSMRKAYRADRNGVRDIAGLGLVEAVPQRVVFK